MTAFSMKTQSKKKIPWSTWGNLLLPILIALIFLAFTFSYYPFREKIQFDSDEGLNLMRSMLVVLGHPLYREVSSDQPPLFTQLLALLLRGVGFDVNPARVLVLLFSGLLVWSCAQFLQITWGKMAAILFLPLIIMVPRYLDLSVSVMIGIPSIALAAVSMLFVAFWHQNKRNLWLVLSGFALALSVLIKLFTGFFVPIFLIGITVSEYLNRRGERFSWKIFRPSLIWSISFAGLAILLGLILVGPQNVWLIIFPHLTAPATEELQGAGYTINAHLRAAVPLLILGIFGALFSIYKRNWLTLYPLAWAALAYTLFSFYSPVFYHHQLLITIPIAMLAAAVVGDGILSLIRLRRPSDLVHLRALFGIIALIGFAWVSIHYVPVLDKELMNRPRLTGFNLRATPGKLKVLRTMNEYIDQTNWIVTDMPMYAFRVQRPVPPILATFSSKRLATGSLTEADILTAMREYHPEQVLMARFVIPPLEEYLQKNYTLVLSEEYFRLFIRNDLKTLIN
jgi:4-amino-4-deoxy-L-arabinose transferase-like glycosyltransferase